MSMRRRNPMCARLCVRIEDVMLIHGPQLEVKIKENSEQLRKVKQQLEAQQSERTRVKYGFGRLIMGVYSS